MPGFSYVKGLAAACSTLMMASCASLSPHVAPDPAQPAPMPVWLQGERPARMDRSVAYTIEQANLWRRKANLQANSQQALYAIALPTSAVAAYYAITGDRGESAITALSAVSAGSFGLSYLSRSQPKQRVYLAGSDALACVIWNAAPLAIPETTYVQMQSRASLLTGMRGDLEGALVRLQGFAEAGDEAWKQKARAAQQAAAAEMEGAAKTTAATFDILAAADRAPYQVFAQTQKIAAAVSQQLIALEPSPEAVLEYARSLNPAIRNLRSALAPPETPPAPPVTQSGALDPTVVPPEAEAALAGVLSVTQALRNRRLELDGLVGTHESALTAAGKLDACAATGGLPPVTITPSVAAARVKPGSAYRFALSGGSGAFDIRVVGGNTEDVTVSYINSPYPSRNPVINFGPKASGAVSVNIRDVSDTDDPGQDIVFTVDAGTTAPAPQENDETDESRPLTGGSLPDPQLGVLVSACPKLGRAQVSIVQLALLSVRKGAPGNAGFVDGQWGGKTEAAAAFYWTDRLGLPGAGGSMKCAFGGLAETGGNAAAQLIGDAQANLFDDRLVTDAARLSISQRCFGHQTLSACWAD